MSRINLSHRYVSPRSVTSLANIKVVSFTQLRDIYRARDRRCKMTGLILIAVVLVLVDTHDHWLRTRFVMTSLCVQILNPPAHYRDGHGDGNGDGDGEDSRGAM